MTSNSCASSTASTQKSRKTDTRSRSGDTVCTSNSSCMLQRRKPMNPLAYSVRPTFTTPKNSVKQRVLSAKLLKLRSIQNQLNDANFHLSELSRENQALRTLQVRQDKALSKYENTNAELPKLLHSHEEEIRVLTEKNKTLKRHLKELTDQLKTRNDELKRAREQLGHYEKLNKDKHLVEREKLMDQLEDLKIKLQKSEEQVSVLNRKVILESKTNKQRLNNEMSKHKQCQRDLIQALEEIDRLTGVLETKENIVHPRNRLKGFPQRQTSSMVTLDAYQANRIPNKDRLYTIRDEAPKTPVSDVKLEPLECKKEDTSSKTTNSILKPPMESIKSRLYGSGGTMKFRESQEPTPTDIIYVNTNNTSSETSVESRRTSSGSSRSRPHSSVKLERLPYVYDLASDSNVGNYKKSQPQENGQGEPSLLTADKDYENREDDGVTSPDEDEKDTEIDTSVLLPNQKTNDKRKLQIQYSSSRPSSGEKFQELSDALDSAIERATKDGCEEFDKKLGDYCSTVVRNVRKCHDVIESHKEKLELSRLDTDVIADTFLKTEKMESKLKQSFFNFDKDDMGLVKDILSEEFKFQQAASKNKMDIDKVREQSRVKPEDKKKLLATLRAIDNGDSVESLESSPPQRQTRLMSQIFGDVSQ